MPSISFASAQLAPLVFDGSFNFANNQLSVGFKRDLMNTNFGYSCHFNFGEDHFSVSPQILYQINQDMTLSALVQASHDG